MPNRDQRRRPLAQIPGILLTSCLVLGTAALKAEPPLGPIAPWLPQDTTVAVRIPNGKAFVDALRQNTKLGTVLFNEERFAQLRELIMDLDPDQWEEFTDDLAKYGLTPDNFPKLLVGDSGFALLLGQDQDDPASPPQAVALAWLEPGKELAERVMDAVGQVAQDHADDKNPVNRVDLEIQGQRVMQLSIPQVSYKFEESVFDWPDDFAEMDDQQQEEVMAKWDQASDQEGQEVLTYSSALVMQAGDHLMMACTLEGASQNAEADKLEQLTSVFARLIGHHDDEAGFITRLKAMPGVQHALPQTGVAGLDVFADLAGLIRLAEAHPDVAQTLKGLGLGQVGAMALRLTLNGQNLEMGMFLAAPEPRTGILALLDQPALATIPPAWVPADLASYSHFSVDLGKGYTHIKRMVLDAFGQEAGMGLHMVEGSVREFAQADLASILSSLGHQHIVLGFAPDMHAMENPKTTGLSMLAQRFALVWQVKNNAIWTRLLQAIEAFAPMTNGALTAADEQGFTGWRLKEGPMEGGLLHGNGYLVLAFGEGVVQRTLSALSNPPKGKDALRTSELYTQATAMIQPQAGMSFQITDGSRYGRSLRKMIMAFFNIAKMDEVENDDDDQLAIQQFQKLIPTEDEFENIFGVSAGYMLVDENGLTMKSASKLPAPN